MIKLGLMLSFKFNQFKHMRTAQLVLDCKQMIRLMDVNNIKISSVFMYYLH